MANDDVGGVRGARPELTPELVEALGVRYGLDAGRARDFGSGLNLNLVVDGAEGAAGVDGRLVVRVYRRYVTPDRLAAIQQVRRAVAAAGVPCSEVVPTRDGAGWVTAAGCCVEVERFVEHDGRMNTQERLLRGLPLLGRIHSAVRDLDVPSAGRVSRFANHIQPEDARAATVRAAARIRAWGPTDAEVQLAHQAEELADQVDAAERDLTAVLPRQVVHGDFWDNNVFLRGERIVHVADFDFMGERARIDDLALTLYFADLQHPVRLDRDERIAALRALTDAYDSGLDDALTPQERAALPWALARQPLWEIGGWVGTLDDEAAARRHLAEMATPLERAGQLVREVETWTKAFR